ncbi:MAG: hypothetical protein EZS28_029032 [Streblomastix strix]|uniref:Uncharacterized protein n=1 Tax=Streblomastix strix TaxID=222440 RepID=A0A5J4UZ58_9EUKA|nr:MAG: hypothetical protein EZS28_029032 [Streblomastix strix]
MATLNGEIALPRSFQYVNSANVTINKPNHKAEVTINRKFFKPCLRTLVLELHEKNKVDNIVTFEFDIGSSNPTIEYLNSENIIFQFPYSLLKDLDQSDEWEISIYESRKREQTNWFSIQPAVYVIIPEQPGDDKSGGKSSKIDIKIIFRIVVLIDMFVIAVIIIFINVITCFKSKDRKHSDLRHKESEYTKMDIEISSLAE